MSRIIDFAYLSSYAILRPLLTLLMHKFFPEPESPDENDDGDFDEFHLTSGLRSAINKILQSPLAVGLGGAVLISSCEGGTGTTLGTGLAIASLGFCVGYVAKGLLSSNATYSSIECLRDDNKTISFGPDDNKVTVHMPFGTTTETKQRENGSLEITIVAEKK